MVGGVALAAAAWVVSWVLIQQAGGFERVGLAAVTERLVGLTLRKEHGASDWSARPIPRAWLEYAALDVEVLPDARDALAEELERQGKQELAAQEFSYALERRR